MLRWRSLLFVPANNALLIDKATAGVADAIILDIEDGVAASDKEHARASLRQSVQRCAQHGKDIIVRVNAGWRELARDLDVAVTAGVTALMIPKAETLARLTTIAEMVEEWEADRNLAGIALIPLVESARGLQAVGVLACAPRVIAVALGPEDFALDMGIAPTAELLDLPCRHIALVAAAAGIRAYATPISISAFKDKHGTTVANALARSYGAHGALCVHPQQVVIANESFAPSIEEVQDANNIWAAWIAGGAEGVVRLDDRMIDAPVAARARRLLTTAGREGAQ